MSVERLTATKLMTGRWQRELTEARKSAEQAGNVIRAEFGRRHIVAYKGPHDVLLRADLRAQALIVRRLSARFPDHHIVAEEGLQDDWAHCENTWAVDPLDGTNNAGYGIAHCAVAICLFHWETAVLAVVFDPIVDRWFVAVENETPECAPPADVSLKQATISLVSGYPPAARRCARAVADCLDTHCKRVCSMWAPALDLALVSTGQLDGMVCIAASFLDVCAGMFLVRAAGGTLLDLNGRPMEVCRSLHAGRVSFVAARSPVLARELLGSVRSIREGW